ncbi:hypothetical protein CaCOL14_009006 [Colletotrichum acutatum]
MDLFQRLDEDISNLIIEHGFLNLDALRFATEREVERAAVRALEMATPDLQLAIAMRQSVIGIEGDNIINDDENDADDNNGNNNAANVVNNDDTGERNASSASQQDSLSTASPAAAECVPAASGAVSARVYVQEAGRHGVASLWHRITSSRPPAQNGLGW